MVMGVLPNRRDAVPLSVVGATFGNTDENCWFSACVLVNEVVYSMPLSSIRLGIPVMPCLVGFIKPQNLLSIVCVCVCHRCCLVLQCLLGMSSSHSFLLFELCALSICINHDLPAVQTCVWCM